MACAVPLTENVERLTGDSLLIRVCSKQVINRHVVDGRQRECAERFNIMGTSLNFTVTGYVGGEPQVKTVGEQQVASFSVAVNRKTSGGKKQTLWVRVNCWNRLSDVAVQFIRKGSLVQVSAEWLRPSSWIANDCEFQRNLRIARKSTVT